MNKLFVFSLMAYITVSTWGFERRTPVVQVYEQTKNVVVNVSGKQLRETTGFDWSDPFGGSLFGPKYRETVVLGSGFVVHQAGYIITNAHVVADTQEIKVTFNDGKEYPAQVISADTSKDIAFLKLESDKKFPYIHLGRSDDLMVGETVIAIGNPFGYQNTVTAGVISAVARDIQVSDDFWLRGLIQTDAAINRGNSGGPLLNINGELIGITTAVRPDAQNIGFAIPVDTIADNLTQMLMPERLRRVQLGLEMGRMKSLAQLTGLEVRDVVKDSPAQKQGIKKGDIILKLDGEPVTSFLDFFVKMIDKQIGEPISIDYVRPSSTQVLSAKIEMLSRPLPNGKALVREFFQMDISPLNEALAKQFGFDKAYPVLIVTGTIESGGAQQAGLAPGDLILQINGSTIGTLEDLSLLMEKVNPGDTVQMRVLRISRRGMMQMQRQYVVELKAVKDGSVKRKPTPGAI